MAAQLQILNLFFLLPLHLPLMKWIATSLLPFLLPRKSSRALTEEKLLIKFRRRSFPPQLDIIKTKASLPELSKLGLLQKTANMMKEAKHNPIYCIAMSREPPSWKKVVFAVIRECTLQRECVRLFEVENPGPRRRKVVAKNIQISRSYVPFLGNYLISGGEEIFRMRWKF